MLLMVVFNAINFGYFFLVAVNVAAAPRSGVEYSIMGGVTPGSLQLPSAGGPSTQTSVSYLVYQDMAGTLAGFNNTTVQVCTSSNIVNGSGTNGSGTGKVYTNCASCSSGSCGSESTTTGGPPLSADPESPTFLLNRVDLTYSFRPLIPGTVFNLALLPSSLCTGSGSSMTCKFHRQVSMRAMN
jgi:hypothetical protein